MNKSSGPSQPPNTIATTIFSFQQQREKFLLTVLRGASAIGIFAVISYLIDPKTVPLLAYIVIVTYIALVVATFVPFPYSIRASIPLIVTYTLGVTTLFEAGIYGDSRLYFLAFTLLVAVLYGRREYFIAMGISLVTIAVMGYLIVIGKVAVTSNEVTGGSIQTWLVETLMFVLITTVFEEGWTRLSQEFNKTQEVLKSTMNALSDEHAHLEDRVVERTANLKEATLSAQKRAESLHAISELSHAVALIQDPDELFSAIARLISENFGFYHVGVFMNDEHNQYTRLRAANSEGGQRLLAQGYQFEIGQPDIISQVAATGKTMFAANINDDPMRYSHTDLPDTRSEIALPLAIGPQILGVLDLQNTEEMTFSEQDAEFMDILAHQVSIAIENTRLLSETRRALSEARAVYGQYMHQAWQQLPGASLTPGYRYLGAKVDSINQPLDLPEVKSAFQTGQIVMPTNRNPNIAVPLKLREEIIGVLDIRSNTPDRQWTENEMALVQAVAERVALAIENARLFEETTRRADRERTVSEITARIRNENDPQTMLQTALNELKNALGASEIRVRPYSAPPENRPEKKVAPAKKKKANPAEQ